MNSRPKRKAVSNRKPTKTLIANVPRRTPAEVKRDKAEAEAAAALSAKEVMATNTHKKVQVAEYEDKLRQEEQALEKTAMRPDLNMAASGKGKVKLSLNRLTSFNILSSE